LQTNQRSSSAPADVPVRPDVPEAVLDALPMVAVQEPDPANVSPMEARLLLHGISPRLFPLLYAGFRFCRTRGQIAETIEIGQLNEADLREAVVAAMVRGWRLDTLILLVIKSRQP